MNCGGPLDSVLIQDLLLGEGKDAENGDSLEVAYTGWLLQNQTIGTVKIKVYQRLHTIFDQGPWLGFRLCLHAWVSAFPDV